MKFYLLTAFGKDRPGIVAELTGALFELGSNIEDASMTRLGGEFSIMLVVRVPSPNFEKQVSALAKKLNLTLTAKPIPAQLASSSAAPQAQHLISVYGTDKPGIIYRVAQCLARRKINITDLNTRVLQRAKEPLYIMLLEVHIPSTAVAEALHADLDRLHQELGVEITLQELDAVPL